MKYLSQGHNDALPSLGTEPRVDNFAIANLRFHPLRCTAASWDDSVKRPSQGHSKQKQFFKHKKVFKVEKTTQS